MEIHPQPIRLDQLLQIAKSPVWDGDLISKAETEKLHKEKLIDRGRGFSVLSLKGLCVLDALGLIKR